MKITTLKKKYDSADAARKAAAKLEDANFGWATYDAHRHSEGGWVVSKYETGR